MLRVCSSILVCIAMTAFGPAANAQGLITVPEGILTPGETIEIEYSNPTRPGETVTIDINDGAFPVPTRVKVEIELDSKGNGWAKWVVPEWPAALFNGPEADEESRAIGDPPPPPPPPPAPVEGSNVLSGAAHPTRS